MPDSEVGAAEPPEVESATSRPAAAGRAWPRSAASRRLVVAVALLLAQYLTISLWVDADALTRLEGGWGFIGQIGRLAPLGVVVATAILLFRRASSRSEKPRVALPPIQWRLVALYVLFSLAFFAVTARIFAAETPPGGSPALWFALWSGLGATSALCLFAGVVGVVALRARLAAESDAVLAGLAVGAAAWVAGSLTLGFSTQLSLATLSVVTAMLRPFFDDLVSDPVNVIIGLGNFEVQVAPECSGLESVGLITVLMTGFLVAFRRELRFPRALLLFVVAAVIVWFGNAFRMAALLILGAYFDAELAHGGFHSKAGWVLFCAISLGVAAIGRRSRFFSRAAMATDDEAHNPTAAYLVPLLALIATALVTGMFVRDVDYFYGLRIVAAGLALYGFRHYYSELSRQGMSLRSVAVGLVVGMLWLVSQPTDSNVSATYHASFEAHPSWLSHAWLALRALGSVLVIPVCEELAFRGYLLRWLVARDFTSVSFKTWTPLAVLGSSIAFGLVHDRWFAATLAGIAFAAVQARSGRLAEAVAAHGISNAVIAAWVLGTGDLSRWL